ncbi:MAG: type II CRISPR RNA-guided endonuclease Cas9 [Pseudomonadota bacterium]|nr:type II CRISPR RNA-guided endonuclease Cas9 [Pseudomonadota bacterium]
MGYNLGIDMGITSVGFAGVDLANRTILFSGAHIFEAAENPKDGSSLAAPRREKRGMRKVIRRRAQRKKAVLRLLETHGLKDTGQIRSPERTHPGRSVWDLRKEALERKLEDAEFARILFHIARRRGFQSNRKDAGKDNEEGKKALKGARDLQEAMAVAGVPTIGAYLATLSKKRNGDGSYERFVTRDLLRQEVAKIFEAQRRSGNIKATQKLLLAYAGDGDLKKRYTVAGDGIAFCQKPLQSSEHLVGTCILTGEKRAPKFSCTAELFVLWSRLNNLRIKSLKDEERPLTQDEKNRLAALAHKNKTGVTWKLARRELDLADEERFNISYRKIKDEDNSWEKIRDAAEKSGFLKMPGYHALKAALDTGSEADWQTWMGPQRDRLDQIAWILSFERDIQRITEQLAGLGLDEGQIDRLSDIAGFSKTVDLSLAVMRDILPYMQEGMTYDRACREAGYDHSRKEGKGLDRVPPFDDIRNPVVNRAMARARKIINACIREHGMPETIIVELGRDVARSFRDRRDIEREQKKNQAYREEARKHVAEILGIVPDNVSGEDILKYRLWKEQDGFCPYSGVYMTPETLGDPVATQIDHIIPYSRSWNDSLANRILCLASENQNKGNDTPVEFFRRTDRNLDALEAFARKLPPKKAENLMVENFDNEKADRWKSRALNDTRYMAQALKNHLEQSLALGEGNRVQTRNGALTARLRSAWGFPEKNRRNDRHHAVDAIVLACSTQDMVKQHAGWNRYEARRKNPAERPLPTKPWETFRNDVMDKIFGPKNEQGTRTGGIFVSRMPVRKITGAAHQETIRSIRALPDGERQIVQRVKLAGLKPDMLENLVDRQRNIKLYTVLKERLDAHGGKPDKAFSSPVYMPSRDPGKQGPYIHSVRVVTNEKSGIRINGGLASNGDMVRVDVFRKDGKFHLVPIYVHHFSGKRLPDRAIVAFKDEKDWLEIDDRDFLFSLYKNDLVCLKSKKEEILGYYNGTHRGTGSINLRSHDSDPGFGKDGVREGIGVKTLLVFEKYSVDFFGRKHRIRKEQRLGLAHRDDPEPGPTEPVERAVEAAE